jgi:NAD(P)-dependent dehydrogenase (short-subunit alcohol dehydrogenase family)
LIPDHSSFGLQDKVAIATRPSEGIGRAIAIGLARAGAHLVLAKHPANRHEEVRQLQAEIEGMGRKTLLLTTDISVVADLGDMVEKTHEAFGRIDILIKNAGWTGFKMALDVTGEEYDDTMAATLKSYCVAVIPPST